MLIQSNGHAPRLNLQTKEHAQNISFLIAAIVAFRNARLKGERAHTWEHGQYGPLQKKLNIPRIYCPVDKYFDQVAGCGLQYKMYVAHCLTTIRCYAGTLLGTSRV